MVSSSDQTSEGKFIFSHIPIYINRHFHSKRSQVMQSLTYSLQLKKGNRFSNKIWSLESSQGIKKVGLIFQCNRSFLRWSLLKLLIRKQHRHNVKSDNLASSKPLNLLLTISLSFLSLSYLITIILYPNIIISQSHHTIFLSLWYSWKEQQSSSLQFLC